MNSDLNQSPEKHIIYFINNNFKGRCKGSDVKPILMMKQVKITTTATVINTDAHQTQRMTSLEIAELTGKQHKNVMQAIRNMEPAWEKTCGLKFQLTSRTIIQPNGGTRKVPCYQLTKTECLYIATKFNDEFTSRLQRNWTLHRHHREGLSGRNPSLDNLPKGKDGRASSDWAF